jgi:hypothetical protein
MTEGTLHKIEGVVERIIANNRVEDRGYKFRHRRAPVPIS